MSMTNRIGVAVLFLFVAAGCATTAPSQALLDARQMRDRAQQSRAPELAPAHVRAAEMELAKAEAQSRNSEEERHFSYIARAKFEAAMAEARRREAKAREEVAHNRFFTEQARIRRESQAQLSKIRTEYEHVKSLLDSTQAELESVQKRIDRERDLESSRIEELDAQRKTLNEQVQLLEEKRVALEAALAVRDARIEVERQARIDAEQRAKSAIDRLQEIASVREAEEGTVITLTGSVLFASGESVLLPAARERLRTVAEALMAQDEKVGIVVEGHTDTMGSNRLNEELSHARATAVKDFLVEQGVDGDRIRAIGRGENEPIATNETAEGRANNRRVEIILNEET